MSRMCRILCAAFLLSRQVPSCNGQDANVGSIRLSAQEITKGTWAGGPVILRITLTNTHERERAKIQYWSPSSFEIRVPWTDALFAWHEHCPSLRRRLILEPGETFDDYLVLWELMLASGKVAMAPRKPGERKFVVSLSSGDHRIESRMVAISVAARPSGKDILEYSGALDGERAAYPSVCRMLAAPLSPWPPPSYNAYTSGRLVRVLEGFQSNLPQETYLVSNLLAKCYCSKLWQESGDCGGPSPKLKKSEWYGKLMAMNVDFPHEYIPALARERRLLKAVAYGCCGDTDAARPILQKLVGMEDHVGKSAEQLLESLERPRPKEALTRRPPVRPTPLPQYTQPSELGKALLAAAAVGDTTKIEALLERGAGIDVHDRNGATPLLSASRSRRKAASMLLIDRGANVSVVGKDAGTPLDWWAAHGDVEVVRALVENGADINKVGRGGLTPLDAARDRPAVTKFLRTHGAVSLFDLIPAASEAQSELQKSSLAGDQGKVKAIMDRGIDVNAKNRWGRTLMHWAASTGLADVASYLIEAGASVDERDSGAETPLHSASRNGQVNVARLLIARGADVNAQTEKGSTPLYLAAAWGHPALVEDLVRKGAHVNAKTRNEWTPLHSAAFSGHEEVARILIEKGADLDALCGSGKHQYTPLHKAAMRGHRGLVELLLAKGARSRATDAGCTPLHEAVRYGHVNTAEAFIRAGASVDLHIAAGLGLKERAVRLLAGGADVDSTIGHNESPLHWSARNGYQDVTALLIAKGADISAKDDLTGATPLHSAASNCHAATVEVLLAAGANVNAKDRHNHTPLDLAAMRREGADVEVVLRRHGGKKGRDIW